ncbi:MAG: 6-phosphogluconolactonase [Solirubrobacteraceae bacterium]
MTKLTVLPDAQAAARYAAHEVARVLREAGERRGAAHLSLAGGTTPRRAYELLAGLLEDWSAVELWYGDERCVGPDDPESNHQLVAGSLLAGISAGPPGLEPSEPGRLEQAREPAQGRAGGPREHRILGELGPDAAARAYATLLRERVPPAAEGSGAGRLPVLDLALLGLGEDGHTASLFPGHPEVQDDSGELCLPVRDAPKPPPERVTLSLPVLRAARHCLLLATGAGKAPALAAVLAGPGGRGSDIPASLLASERLHIVVDAAAAPAAA